MSEWFIEKKREFYWWLEEAPIPAKMGAVIALAIFLVFLIAFPLGVLIVGLIAFVLWLLFALLESVC